MISNNRSEEDEQPILQEQEVSADDTVGEIKEEPIKIEKPSHLPAWLLKSKSRLSESQQTRQFAETRISKIYEEVGILEDKLKILRPVKVLLEVASAQSANTSQGRSPRSTQSNSTHRAPPTNRFIDSVPSDLTNEIFLYLLIKEIFLLSNLSKKYYQLIRSSDYWWKFEFFRHYFLFLESSNCYNNNFYDLYSIPRMAMSSNGSVLFSSVLTDFQFMKRISSNSNNDSDRSRCSPDSSVDLSMSQFSYYSTIRKTHFPSSLRVFQRIQSFYRQFFESLLFMRMMKDQRSLPKHKQIHPRRYSRSERSVTHPLPLLEEEKIMSSTETLQTEFRSFAHRILDTIVQLTGSFLDLFCNQIIQEGIVTILVSLLSNEEATIQNYSCAILANLLCWETLVKKKIEYCHQIYLAENNSNNDKVKKQSTPDISHLKSYKYPLIDQIVSCQGQKQLSLLLTSPSASINLAGGTRREPSQLPQQQQYEDGNIMKQYKMTSSIQGVSNKHSSRALVCMYFPESPVASRILSSSSSSKQDLLSVDHLHLKPAVVIPSLSPGNNNNDSSSSSNKNPLDSSSIWKFTPTAGPLPPIRAEKPQHSSSSSSSTSPNVKNRTTNTTTTTPMATTTTTTVVNERSVLHGNNNSINKNSSDHSKSTSSNSNKNTTSSSLSSTSSLPPLLLFFLADDHSRPWQFTYFFKTGSFKDQFLVSLRFFSIHCIRGKGMDSIGSFTLEGRMEMDIIGQKLLLNKIYHHDQNEEMNEKQQQMSLDNDKEALDGTTGQGRGGMAVHSDQAAHVKHLGYWSDGVRFPSNPDKEEKSEMKSEHEQQLSYFGERWSQGLWGVWETATTNQSHYELQKGGFFRAIPLE
jgi:hypothetical protein